LEELRAQRHSALFGGWALFDDRLAEMVGQIPELKVSLRGLANEEFLTNFQDIAATWVAGLSPQSEVIQHLFKIVRSLATQGKVIVVGRAGACLTRSIPGGIHLRLVAPLRVRIRHLCTHLGLSEVEAASVVAERDNARAALVKTYFHRDIEDPLLYDAVWNTETVPPTVIAATVVRWMEARWKTHHRLPARRVLKVR
jgi:cytidylate kinase